MNRRVWKNVLETRSIIRVSKHSVFFDRFLHSGLNAILKLADSRGLLRQLHPKINERAFMYADDVVIFLSPEQQDLILIRVILDIFAGASGLKTNLDKCSIWPIQCNLEATVMLLSHFPGKIAPFPIQYLGIPLGLRKPSKTAMQPLVDKVANRLPAWMDGLLNRAGMTVLIRAPYLQSQTIRLWR